MRQVALADTILITKLDLVEHSTAKSAEAQLTARLRRLNPAARIMRIDDPAFDLAALLHNPGFDPAAPGTDPRPC